MGNLSVPASYILWFTMLLNPGATLDAIRSSSRKLATSITMEASKQTYYTMRLLADQDRIQQGFQAYAYFRWVDDRLDKDLCTRAERLGFIERQQSLLAALVAHQGPGALAPEESILADLISSDPARDSGLRSYLQNMMQVMVFDTERRGQLISQNQLEAYTHHLAIAVTELLHYLIGNGSYSPKDGSRYAAASAAHIVHMLRDTYEDVDAGYFNVPREILVQAGISPAEVHHPAYRRWVCERTQLANAQFHIARNYLSRVESLRCRLAGYTYMNRFENVLALIKQDNYVLRSQYPRRRTLGGVATFFSSLFGSLVRSSAKQTTPVRVPAAEPRKST